MALEQTFISPDGALSFGYPSGWTVAVPEEASEEVRRWVVSDAAEEQVLSLIVRPDEGMYKVSPPLTPLVIPQGQIPGVLEGLGAPAVAAVAASPGQSVGGNASVLYGMTWATGADPVFGDIRWGEGYLLSFSGHQMLGPHTEVDMAAEAEEFAGGSRFRTQILRILQSLTATAAPAAAPRWAGGAGGDPGGQEAPAETPAPTPGPEGSTEAACTGVQYTYENLQGITCPEAKAILQVVTDTGEPIGARAHRSPAVVEAMKTRPGEPHVAPLNAMVRDINTDRGLDRRAPWFDPGDGGIHAEVLFLLECPGG
ncbi:hypothetical protein, partial [Kocuria dechangensis]|uniref:hypothetical protein n=1 Tax=Kocuria dechangensis TaxID=1176249 RepID=UPI001E569B3D